MEAAMASGMQLKEHMEVVGSDGKHVGIVDRLEGERIKLAKTDPKAGGKHHFIPREWIVRVGAHVHLSKTSRDAMEHWQTEEPAPAREKAR
jgi:hypothetical protein